MRKTRESPFTGDSPEWTAKHQATAIPFIERFPHLAEAARDASEARRVRGPQKAPTKQPVNIRLSPDVLLALRATGRGWQGKVDEILRTWVESEAKPKRKTASAA